LYLPLPDEVSSVYLVAGPLNENLAVPNDAIELFGRIEDSAGEALGGALDFNGDGQNDVLIGAPALMGNRVGGAFVVHGPVTEDLDLDSADSWFEGVQPGYGEGRSVAGVADMNGDGRDEVLMGQSGLQGGQGPHVAWLFLGGEGSTRRVTEADDTFSAEKGEYSHPMTVTGLGDVDGDGYGDCALGSTVENNYEGKVWVIAGGLNAGTGAGLDAAIATIDSEQSGDRLGAAIAGPGDLNGDGFAEVLIGMPEASLTDVVRNEGRNTLLYGPLIGRTDVSLESSSIRVLSGELEGQRAGQGLGAAGDVNGDGYVDLFLSSSALGGQAWIFFTGLAETGS